MKRVKVVQKDWILQNQIEEYIIKEVEELSRHRATRLTTLFKNGCETAYIARYREDVHGGLKPESIRKAKDAYVDAVALNAKVSAAITTITAKVIGLNEKRAITERLQQCEDFEELADISKEFTVGARKTKANIARELGLEPPAKTVLDGKFVDFASYVSKDLKTEKEVEEHMKILLADLINKEVDVRKLALKIVKLETTCCLTIIPKLTRDAAKNKEELERKNILRKYSDYIGTKMNPNTIKSHTVSALNRGAEEGVITWKVECKPEDAKKIHPYAQKTVYFGMKKFFKDALSYSIQTYFIPMLERGAKKYLTKRSEERSIVVFGQNVEQLFSQQGVHSKYVIALDPGSTVKAAFLDPSGNVISMNQFSIRDSSFDSGGVTLLKKWASQTIGKDIVFAIGNGSKTHSTQKAVSRLIENNEFTKGVDVCFCVVPEHGASKYSCTDAAREEFGENAEIKQISAVSIGRRLIDPMSEYVKIEPQHLGKGQYQLSVNGKLLKEKLADVVRDRVSLIGADVNLASEALLKNICGLNQTTAAEIVKYRGEHGRFRSREELKKVKGIGGITFQQCSGFLTVSRPDESDCGPPAKRFRNAESLVAWSPFDETVVHPDDYYVAIRMLEKLHLTVDQIKCGIEIPFANLTLEESQILNQLKDKPTLKPPPMMMKKSRDLKDLKRGERFSGTVSNKTDFGVFVDIGVEKDGLIHISHFRKNTNSFHANKIKNTQKDALEGVPSVGDQIEVIVEGTRENKISLIPV